MSGNSSSSNETSWHRVLRAGDLPEGRVTTVTAGHRSIALTHFEGQLAALNNRHRQTAHLRARTASGYAPLGPAISSYS